MLPDHLGSLWKPDGKPPLTSLIKRFRGISAILRHKSFANWFVSSCQNVNLIYHVLPPSTAYVK